MIKQGPVEETLTETLIQRRGATGHRCDLKPPTIFQYATNPQSLQHRPEAMATHSILLPGKFHGQRSLAGYSPWGHKESNTTEWLHFTPLHFMAREQSSEDGSARSFVCLFKTVFMYLFIWQQSRIYLWAWVKRGQHRSSPECRTWHFAGSCHLRRIWLCNHLGWTALLPPCFQIHPHHTQ